MNRHEPPEYYVLESVYGRHTASHVIAMLGDLDGYETWAIGDAIAYLVRAGRKTPDPTEDLEKARNSLVLAMQHRIERLRAETAA